jgi:hypothetical protein
VDVELGCSYPRTCVRAKFSRPRSTSSGQALRDWFQYSLGSRLSATGCPLTSSREPIPTSLFSDHMEKENGGRGYGNCRGNLEPAYTAGDMFYG